MADVQVKGLAELQRALDELPAKIEANIMRGAMRAGAKVLAKGAKANVAAIRDTGLLQDDIRYGAQLDSKAGQVYGYVRAGGHGGAFYAHMVEKGTAAHFIRVKQEARPTRMTRRGVKAYSIGTINKMVKRGSLTIGGSFVGASVSHPGAKKKPFLRPALDMHATAAVEAMREYIRQRLATKHGIDVPAPVDPEAEE